MHKEIQIAPGVYVTDFRKGEHILGLAEQKSQLTNDVGLLLDSIMSLQDRINQLQYSIEEIQKEAGWQEDSDFVEAVEENWLCIIKFSTDMKERVLKLFQLKYHPESEKIENILKISRIQEREQKAIEHLKKKLENKQQSEVLLDEIQEHKNFSGKATLVEVQDQPEGKKTEKQPESESQSDGGVFV